MASISIRCPSCSATEGVVRNGKSTAGHQRYLCSHCRKTWQLQFTYTASQPGKHQKIIDMAMNGVGCRASARIAEQQKLIEEALRAAEGAHREELEKQRLALEQKIQEVHAQYERAKSMAQLTKQGHVYIISNIGSFGENVFKIGMTRRLEPMDRVKELSGASVPFDFDVHAMISCDDAPALEKTLHDSLEKYRINRINLRKEFFRVKLEKIINEVERHHGQVEYVADPAALQYLQSLEYAENEAA
ncbi:Chromosome segregation ATPase from phage origin, putative coiled-coil [Escherichia coli]|nr:GIY-YIG nuclease family protein [Escherichia coli]EEW0712349.1 GIY-YIG nuclease family protein [Escherichia coli]SQJ69742.1 Chromosome segregation ATPase from phage origin, putative coiled-coil [Escherichia coli]